MKDDQDYWRGGIKLLTSGEEKQELAELTEPPVHLNGGRIIAFPQERWFEHPLVVPHCDIEVLSRSSISDPEVYKEAKNKLAVGCVDLWLVYEDKVLLGRRASKYDVLSGWWWPIGGRILSDERGVIPFEESALLTLQLETGIKPESIESLFWLGTGMTQFSDKLQYQDKNHKLISEAELESPFSTVNINLLAKLNKKTQPGLSRNISDYWWVEVGEIEQEPGNNLSAYVASFLRGIFTGFGLHDISAVK